MNTQEITEAILHIHKEAIFTIIGKEIYWLDDSISQPTKTEIENAHKALITSKSQAKAQAEAAKAAAEAKLAALGLTSDDLKALGL